MAHWQEGACIGAVDKAASEAGLAMCVIRETTHPVLSLLSSWRTLGPDSPEDLIHLSAMAEVDDGGAVHRSWEREQRPRSQGSHSRLRSSTDGEQRCALGPDSWEVLVFLFPARVLWVPVGSEAEVRKLPLPLAPP